MKVTECYRISSSNMSAFKSWHNYWGEAQSSQYRSGHSADRHLHSRKGNQIVHPMHLGRNTANGHKTWTFTIPYTHASPQRILPMAIDVKVHDEEPVRRCHLKSFTHEKTSEVKHRQVSQKQFQLQATHPGLHIGQKIEWCCRSPLQHLHISHIHKKNIDQLQSEKLIQIAHVCAAFCPPDTTDLRSPSCAVSRLQGLLNSWN